MPNESGLFYVLTEEDVEVDPPQRAIPREPSLVHALFRAKFGAVLQDRDPDAITAGDCEWVERHGRNYITGTDSLEIKLGNEGRANVIVSSELASLERMFLSDPDGTNRMRLEISATGLVSRTSQSFPWPTSDEAQRFCGARAAFFTAVLGGEKQLVMQGADLIGLRELAQNYAAGYVGWLEVLLARAASGDESISRAAFDELKEMLTLDTVSLLLRDYRGKQRDAILVGPMHPLRALWHTTWASTADFWLKQARKCDKEFVVPTRDALLRQLAPSGLPAVVLTQELGRSYIGVDNVNPFWSLYGAKR